MNPIWYNAVLASSAAGFAYDAIPNLVHVYEIARRTLTSYTGPLVRLRRASDSAQSDFGALANGDLDVASIATWAGGDSFIHTIYDQVGSDNTIQATAGNQPLFVASGQNGRAVGRYDGSTKFMRAIFSGAVAQAYSIYVAARMDSALSTSRTIYDGDDTSTRIALFNNGPSQTWVVFAGASMLGSTSNTNWNILSVLANTTASQLWVNGSSQVIGNIGTQSCDGLFIGQLTNAQSRWAGDIAPLVLADPEHDATARAALETAINSYYAIY